MPDLTLYITHKNYSSWSLRAWLLMRAFEIPFEEALVPMTADAGLPDMTGVSPTGKVPCLVDRVRGVTIWESIAIAAYLAEEFPDRAIWPDDRTARARARSHVAEMHAGFMALRSECPMNLRRRPAVIEIGSQARRDVARVETILAQCLGQSGGPFLAGEFSALDAFFVPVLMRLQTYRLSEHAAVRVFAEALDTLPAWREWRAAALAETIFIPVDEIDMQHEPHVT